MDFDCMLGFNSYAGILICSCKFGNEEFLDLYFKEIASSLLSCREYF